MSDILPCLQNAGHAILEVGKIFAETRQHAFLVDTVIKQILIFLAFLPNEPLHQRINYLQSLILSLKGRETILYFLAVPHKMCGLRLELKVLFSQGLNFQCQFTR